MRKLIRFLVVGMVLLAIAALLSSVTVRQALAQTIRAALIKNLDGPARAPFQFFFQARRGDPACGTNFCAFYLPIVPANKRLVITNFSSTIHLDATATVQHLRMYLFDSSFNPVNQFTVPYNPNVYPADTISANNPRRYVTNEQLRWYIEAGDRALLSFHTTGGSLDTTWSNQFLITGYLVDLSL